MGTMKLFIHFYCNLMWDRNSWNNLTKVEFCHIIFVHMAMITCR
uniref:Uncharacterized protein n=1 Tax=Anguilla anguilla TaxID=7936 RepID=A0A0E9XJ59_ANGAN